MTLNYVIFSSMITWKLKSSSHSAVLFLRRYRQRHRHMDAVTFYFWCCLADFEVRLNKNTDFTFLDRFDAFSEEVLKDFFQIVHIQIQWRYSFCFVFLYLPIRCTVLLKKADAFCFVSISEYLDLFDQDYSWYRQVFTLIQHNARTSNTCRFGW